MSFHPLMPYGTEGWHRSDRVLLEKGEPFAFTRERAAQLEDICSKYPPERRKSAVGLSAPASAHDSVRHTCSTYLPTGALKNIT